MKKLLLLILFPMMCSSQNYLSLGIGNVFPKTDVDYENGINLSISSKHKIKKIILQPIVSISQFKGIDNDQRKNRQYSYETYLLTTGLNIMNTGKFYTIIGLHYNSNLISSRFKLHPNQYDKINKSNLFISEYLGIGYSNKFNVELGIFYTNTNYL